MINTYCIIKQDTWIKYIFHITFDIFIYGTIMIKMIEVFMNLFDKLNAIS